MRRIITLRTYTAADLAAADTDTADFCCIITGGVTANGNLILLEKYKKRGVETIAILREVIRQMQYYKCAAGFIERNRFEGIMRTCQLLVKRGVFGDPVELRRLIGRITLIDHYAKSKEERFQDNLQPMHDAGAIWFPRAWDDVRDFFALYPAVEHDDDGDVIEMLISHSKAPSKDVSATIHTSVAESLHTKSDVSINAQLAKRHYNIWTGSFRRS